MSEPKSESVLILPPERQQRPAPPGDTSPTALLAIAVQKGASVEQMQQLLALQERWEANEARKAFVEAMAKFKAEPLVVFKKQTVDFTSAKGRTHYKHATLSDVTDVVAPAMAKHGLSYRWGVSQEPKSVSVACVVTHQRGHSESVSMTAPLDDSGNKNPIQMVGSTVTYLQRYTLLAVTGLATQNEQDDDGRSGAEIDTSLLSPEDQGALDTLRAAAMEGEEALQTAFKASAISDTGWNVVRLSLIDAAKKADADRVPAKKVRK